jgi:ketosteroid isomerase-like protein
MSIDVVKAMYAAFQEGDMPGVLSFVSDDCQWDHRGPEGPPLNKLFVGPAGVEEFFRLYAETQEPISFEVTEYFGERDRVVVLGSHFARVRATGKEWGGEFAFSHTVKDGKITRWNTVFDMTQEAEAYKP